MHDKPPLYKELLVGLLVGGLLGPLLGWFIGTFATFFAITAIDTNNVRSLRGSGFIGGMIGIPLGLATGGIVSLPLRVVSTRVLTFLKKPWLAGVAGSAIGSAVGYLILTTWYSNIGGLIYVMSVCMAVGGLTGCVVVIAKPKWL